MKEIRTVWKKLLPTVFDRVLRWSSQHVDKTSYDQVARLQGIVGHPTTPELSETFSPYKRRLDDVLPTKMCKLLFHLWDMLSSLSVGVTSDVSEGDQGSEGEKVLNVPQHLIRLLNIL